MNRILIVLLLSVLPVSVNAQNDDIDDEKAIKVFSYLLSGDSAARSHLNSIRQIAANTPFKPSIVAGISRQLLVWGWKAQESSDLIAACANAAVGVGADDEKFARITLLVGRLTDAEESTYAALSNLEDEGVPAWQLMAYLVGKSVEEVKRYSLRRELRPKRTAEALIAGFNEKYKDAAVNEAKKRKGFSAPAPQSPVTEPKLESKKPCYEGGRKVPCS